MKSKLFCLDRYNKKSLTISPDRKRKIYKNEYSDCKTGEKSVS